MNMHKEGLKPDLYTMNAVLDVLVKRRYRRTGDIALEVLAEMKKLNIGMFDLYILQILIVL